MRARRRKTVRPSTAVVAAVLLGCVPARATLDPAALRSSEEARRRAVAGDLAGAQRDWDAVLAAHPGAFAVRLATTCDDPATELRRLRDLAPLWVTTLADGCHEILWGHLTGEADARSALARVPAALRGADGEVVALSAPLARQPASSPATAPAPAPTVAGPAPAPPTPAASPATPTARPPEPAVTAEPPPAAQPPRAAEAPPAAPSPSGPSGPAPARPAPGETAADLFGRGTAAYTAGDLDAAIAAFEGALVLDPDNARALNNLGATWLLKGDAARAATLAQRALDLDPGYARASLNLGTALFALDRAEEARPYLERAVELDPSNVDARNNLASLLVELREWAAAETVLLDALEVAPGEPRLTRQLAQVQAQRGVRQATPAAPERAAAAGQPPTTAPPAAPPAGGPCARTLSRAARARFASQLFEDGREAYARGDMGAAEAILERALECDPTSAVLLNHLGAARLQAGDAPGAESAFALALQIQPDLFEARVNLAQARLEQGRCDAAIADLRSLAAGPASGEAAFQLAQALYRCGHAVEAASALDEAQRLLPGDARIAALRDRLGRQELPRR